MSRVTVHIDEAKIETVQKHLYSELLFPVKPNFEFLPLQGTRELSDGAKLTPIPLVHPGGSHGFRVDWTEGERKGKSLAYITDTTASSDSQYIEDILGVETLIHECYFPDGWEDRAELTGHSCLTPVAQVAAKAGAKRLYLVHINPLNETENPLDLESIKPIFDNVTVATDQLEIEV